MNDKRIKQIIRESIGKVLAEDKAEKANFLDEIRKGTKNRQSLQSISENNVRRMIDTHSESGYIVISPCRGGGDFGIDTASSKGASDKLAEINSERFREMIGLIKKSPYSYTPTYGGFIENQGTDMEENVYERSCIIYNKDRNGNTMDFAGLYEFGLDLCRRYNQDSFLVQEPGKKPRYVTQDGDTDFEFDGEKTFYDLSQTYFTDLHKNTDKFGDISNRKPTRFSFLEAYVNPKPQCYSESHARWASGEVF